MSIKRNIIANYISQIYISIVSIIVVPLYIRYMSTEAYGLIGFYSTLQMCFTLLDLGLTPTMARETARYRGGANKSDDYRDFVRVLEGIFIFIAILGCGVMCILSTYLASHWLQVKITPINEIINSIKLMAITIALRWMCGLYRSAISGSEKLVWLGCYNILITTLRYIGIFYVLIYIDSSITYFFGYQLVIAICELTGLIVKAYSIMPIKNRRNIRWTPIKKTLRLSLNIALGSSMWIMITQTDKLVLSSILPLGEYGYFSMAVLLASGILIIGNAVSGAVIPRLVKLEAEENHQELIVLYRQSTQFVSVISGAASITMYFFAKQLLWVWVGDITIANQTAPILKLYCIGNAILSITAFAGYMQYVKGDLKLDIIGNFIFLVSLVPTSIWAGLKYGGIGVGYVWVLMNIMYFIIWVPLVHNRFYKSLNIKWFVNDTGIIYLFLVIYGYILYEIIPDINNRFYMLVYIFLFGFIVMFIGLIASSFFYKKIQEKLLNLRCLFY